MLVYYGATDNVVTNITYAYKTLGLCITSLGNGEIVFSGGRAGHIVPNNHFKLNLDTGGWTSLAGMPSNRYYHGCTTIDKGNEDSKNIKLIIVLEITQSVRKYYSTTFL